METTILQEAGFWGMAAMMIVGALGVVFSRSIVYSALMLLVSFLAIAGVFVMLNAPFLAAAQILVYGVGLTIVLIFGIMLTGDKPTGESKNPVFARSHIILSVLCAGTFLGFALWAILNPDTSFANHPLFIPNVDIAALADRTRNLSDLAGLLAVQTDGGVGHIAGLLFTRYLVPFELASILLLLAMMGAIILSKRIMPEEEGELPLPYSEAGVSSHDLSDEPAREPAGVH